MMQADRTPHWRTFSIEKTLKTLGSDPGTGLSHTQVLERRAQHGWNRIPEPPRPSLLSLWLRQFKSPLIGILLFAGAVLLLLEHTSDAIVIFAVLALNSIIGTFQEYKAQKTVAALKKLTPHSATVRRDGVIITLPAEDIVPGDILILSEGDRIVADARLIESNFLRTNESLLTGESLPSVKDAHAHPKKQDQLDAPNMVFAGTSISHGHGSAVVVATGGATRLGAISASIHASRTPIPLERDLGALSKIVLAVIGGLLLIITLLGLRTNLEISAILYISVALAVSAIPEGLPAVLTIVLSTGMARMAKRSALVKKLFAVEALGQVRVLAVDKTGTITLNEMMVVEMYTPSGTIKITGNGYAPHGSFYHGTHITPLEELGQFQRIAALLPPVVHATVIRQPDGSMFVSGDPTEAAMLVLAQKMNAGDAAAITSTPFDYQKKIALAETESDSILVGAPEAVLTRCDCSEAERGAHATALESLAERGLRVVAVARKPRGNTQGYTFEAFLGIADAVRPEAAATIARVKGAGLKVVMITGDLPTTARTVAREVGIFERGDHILTGKELHDLSESELRALLPRISVFARVTPEDKLRIVELYQKTGHTIAMTGDGVNDAPSLVAAELGVAMGKSGTDVARQAADILLLNDNLGSIVAAIDEGRTMYQTLRKVLVYLFATNFGEICIVATSLAFQLPIPIIAVQVIWLNLVTDGFLDISLALEPKEDKSQIPRLHRTKYLLQRPDFISIAVTGGLMTIGTLYMFHRYDDLPLDTRRTIALVVMAMFQWIHAWALRTERRSFFRTSLVRNPYLIAATIIIITLQVLAVYTPFLQSILHTTPVAPRIWGEALLIASSILWVEELRKMYRRHKIKA